jgi:tetratricopeptide (TPR) repeat protein
LLLIRHGQHDRAAIQLDELDDATLSLAPISWMRRYFRLMNFSAGLKRLPLPSQPKTPESVPAQIRAINAWISEGQLDSAITALDNVIQSAGAMSHFKRLLYFARKLEHVPVLERLLGDPAFSRQSDAQTQFEVCIELAQIHSRRKDDDGIRRALGAIDIGTIDAPLRRRLLDTLALMDSQKACLEFAGDHLRFSSLDLEYLTLRRTVLLNESKPKLARAQLTELVKRLSNDSHLWEMASQLFATQSNTHAAIGAQRNAIRFAAKPVPHELRLRLAGLYTSQQRHFHSRLQLMFIRWTPILGPEELRPSRDFAVRHGYFWIAGMFAKTLCKANPQDLDALIALCWIYCRIKRNSKALEIAARAINEIDNGRVVSRAAWPILIQALLALGRNDDARRMIGRGLDAFPNNKALLKIRDARASVKDLVSRINAR